MTRIFCCGNTIPYFYSFRWKSFINVHRMLFYIAGFIICALIIFFAGKRLSHYGDLLAELSGMGKAWIGLILMAAVTSLPELMVGISSAVIIQSADLAVGDIIGSCAFNLGILSMMDIFTPKDRPLFSHVSKSHILAAAFGIILMSLVGLNLYIVLCLF